MFHADQAGFITGIRFYKGTGNAGVHTGRSVRRRSRLATVSSAASRHRLQPALFASPVAVTADTTLHGLLYAPVGRYAADLGYFAARAHEPAPDRSGEWGRGGNGGNLYGSGGGFPSSSYQSTNYWVDVVFESTAVDTTKPT